MSEEYYGESAEARARRRRTIITVLIVLFILFFAAWYALSYIRADDARRTTTPSSTSESPTCELTPGQVEVNVYNATTREGLAAQVARDLKKRGFDVTSIANDPKRVEVTGRGELRHGSNGTKGAELVAQHVGEFADVGDERERPAVDVVLGPDYRHLVHESRVPDC